eukprot:gene28815-32004_t
MKVRQGTEDLLNTIDVLLQVCSIDVHIDVDVRVHASIHNGPHLLRSTKRSTASICMRQRRNHNLDQSSKLYATGVQAATDVRVKTDPRVVMHGQQANNMRARLSMKRNQRVENSSDRKKAEQNERIQRVACAHNCKLAKPNVVEAYRIGMKGFTQLQAGIGWFSGLNKAAGQPAGQPAKPAVAHVHDYSSSGGSMDSLDFIMQMVVEEDKMEDVPHSDVEGSNSQGAEGREVGKECPQDPATHGAQVKLGPIRRPMALKMKRNVEKRTSIRAKFLESSEVIMTGVREGIEVSAHVSALRERIWNDVVNEINNADMGLDTRRRSFPVLWYLRTLLVAIRDFPQRQIVGEERDILNVLKEYGMHYQSAEKSLVVPPPSVATEHFAPASFTEYDREHILLVRLKPNTVCNGSGEALQASFFPRLGNGKEHARWSPVSACFFRNKRTGRQSGSEAEAEGGEQPHKQQGESNQFLKNAQTGEPSHFHFFVEPVNQSISPYVLVVMAFRFLIERVKKIRKSVVDSETGFVFEAQSGLKHDLRQANDFVMAMFVEGLDYISNKLTGLTLEWIHFCKLDTFNFVGVNEFVMHDNNAKAARVWAQAAEEAGKKKKG